MRMSAQSDTLKSDTRKFAQMSLSDEAIERVVLLTSGSARPDDWTAFEQWRRQSDAHERAAQEAEALWRDIGQTPQARAAARSPLTLKKKTRTGLLACAALAASIAIVFAANILQPASAIWADHATAPGERLDVALPDGSTVLLNAASSLSVAYEDNVRRVILHEGEALFTIKSHPLPFIVTAEYGDVRVHGTVFSVREQPDSQLVRVSEGTISLHPANTPDQPIRLRAGQQIRTDGVNTSPITQAQMRSALAWTRGKLIFNRHPLSDVVAELQRYQKGRILITNSDLAGLRVSGIVDLNRIGGFPDNLADIIGVRTLRLPLLTILY